MIGWHHGLNGQESEQTPGDSEGQGSLVCCNSWDHKALDTTERLNGIHSPELNLPHSRAQTPPSAPQESSCSDQSCSVEISLAITRRAFVSARPVSRDI